MRVSQDQAWERREFLTLGERGLKILRFQLVPGEELKARG